MATSASLIMIPKPFVEWDHKDVEVFLNHNKQKYILNKDAIDRIVGQEYSGRSLLTLTTDDLVRYGMKDGPARNVMSLLTDLEQTIGVREPRKWNFVFPLRIFSNCTVVVIASTPAGKYHSSFKLCVLIPAT